MGVRLQQLRVVRRLKVKGFLDFLHAVIDQFCVYPPLDIVLYQLSVFCLTLAKVVIVIGLHLLDDSLTWRLFKFDLFSMMFDFWAAGCFLAWFGYRLGILHK